MRRLALAAVMLIASAACGSPPGPGGAVACTQIGCDSGVTFAVSGVGLDAGGGTVVAEACFDGRCERARYTQEANGAAEWDNTQLQLFVGPDSVEVMLRLPEDDYDPDAAYDVSLELRVDGGEPMRLDRRVHLERSQPNGPDCPPVCWQARVEHAA